jgi:hypothetical protein
MLTSMRLSASAEVDSSAPISSPVSSLVVIVVVLVQRSLCDHCTAEGAPNRRNYCACDL